MSTLHDPSEQFNEISQLWMPRPYPHKNFDLGRSQALAFR